MKPTTPDLGEIEILSYESFVRLLDNDERIIDASVEGDPVAPLRHSGARFDTVRLSGSICEEAELSKLQALDVVWTDCSLVATNLENSSLERVEFSECRADGIQLMEADLQKVRFVSSKMTLANFRNVTLRNVLFSSCDLTEADFYGAKIENVWFENCILHDVNFASIQGKNIDLRTSDCRNISGLESLSGAIISGQQLIELAPEFARALGMKVSDD